MCRGGNVSLLGRRSSFPPISFNSATRAVARDGLRFRGLVSSSSPPATIFFSYCLSTVNNLDTTDRTQVSIPRSVSFIYFSSSPLFGAVDTAVAYISRSLADVKGRTIRLLLGEVRKSCASFPGVSVLSIMFRPQHSMGSLSRRGDAASKGS